MKHSPAGHFNDINNFILKTFCRNKYILIFALPNRKVLGKQTIEPVCFNNHDLVAQLVEQYTFNVWVLGSSPNGITFKTAATQMRGCCFLSF